MIRRFVACSSLVILAAGSSAQQPAAPAKTQPQKSPTAAAKTPAKTSATTSSAPASAASKAAKTPVKAPAKAGSAPAPATPKEKFSYALGMNFSLGMKQSNLDIDLEVFLRGLRDAHAGASTQMTRQEMAEVLTRAQQEMQAKQEGQQKLLAEKNKREGDAFLAQNKARPGVVTLPSGLQYEIITPGAGPSPKTSDAVTVHYRGTLIDGTEFDSSYKRGEPATFSLSGGLIKGWLEALPLMKVGAKWKLYVPSEQAYGEQQRGQFITPHSVLVFEIELLAIKEPAAQK